MSNYTVSISAPSEWCCLGAGVAASEVGAQLEEVSHRVCVFAGSASPQPLLSTS